MIDSDRSVNGPDLVNDAGAGSSPERAGHPAAPRVPVQLTAAEIADAMRRLTKWYGNIERLIRTVTLPADRHEPLLDRIRRDEDALNHAARTRRHGDDIVFMLWTRSTGGVTNLDVELAERIDAAVLEMGPGN